MKNTKIAITSLAIAASCFGVSTRAEAAIEILAFTDFATTYSFTGQDNLILGTFLFLDGNNYVGAYDARDGNNCKPYIAVRAGATMKDNLTGSSQVYLDAGNDGFTVMNSTMFPVGGPNGMICRNLPVLSSLSYAGHVLIIQGGAGADTIIGGNGADYIWGGDGNDVIYESGSSNILHGDAGNDDLHGDVNGGTLFGEGGNDVVWINSYTQVSTSTGSDRLVLSGAPRSGYVFDCGADPDRYVWSTTLSSSQWFVSCETKVSYGTCVNRTGI